MKSKWNVNPTQATTIARLLSELEGVSYLLSCLDEVEELEFINTLKKKYYKEYFKRLKEEKQS
jgi:hypothetical protein